jgi:hypothetical protein
VTCSATLGLLVRSCLRFGQAGLLVDAEDVAAGVGEPGEHLTGGGIHWPHDLASGSYHRIQGSHGLGHHDVDEEARPGRTALGGRLISQMSLFAEQVEELTWIVDRKSVLVS